MESPKDLSQYYSNEVTERRIKFQLTNLIIEIELMVLN